MIQQSYNNLLFLSCCLSVKNDPFVFRSYFFLLKLVTSVSVRYTRFVLCALLFDNLHLRIREILSYCLWRFEEAEVQGSSFLFVNIYAPNSVQDQCCFYDNLNKNIEEHIIEKDNRIVLGVDKWGAKVDVNANWNSFLIYKFTSSAQDFCLNITNFMVSR